MEKIIILHKSRTIINMDDWTTEAFVFDEIFLQFGQRVLDPGLIQQAGEQGGTEYYELAILKHKKSNKWLVYGHHFTPDGISQYPKYCGAKATQDGLEEKVREVAKCLNLSDNIVCKCLQDLYEEV